MSVSSHPNPVFCYVQELNPSTPTTIPPIYDQQRNDLTKSRLKVSKDGVRAGLDVAQPFTKEQVGPPSLYNPGSLWGARDPIVGPPSCGVVCCLTRHPARTSSYGCSGLRTKLCNFTTHTPSANGKPEFGDCSTIPNQQPGLVMQLYRTTLFSLCICITRISKKTTAKNKAKKTLATRCFFSEPNPSPKVTHSAIDLSSPRVP
jgi:hypothetical protein